MNVHVSYRLHKIPAVEKDIQHQIEKLQKRLQVFRPELVHLKGVVEETSPREGTSVSLNLRLPSGQMAVQASAPTAAAAVKSAFEDLLQQVNKHKEILRASHKWQRGRRGDSARPGVHVSEVPFEHTLAAVFPPTISADDVRSYVNVNLARLERFVEREIYFREAQESIPPDTLTTKKSSMKPSPPLWAMARRSRNGWRWSLGSTAWRCGLSTIFRAPTRATATPCIWKTQRAAATSRPATKRNCSFISRMSPSPARPSFPTARVATPEQILASDEMSAPDRVRPARSGLGSARSFHSSCDRRLQRRRDCGDYRPSGRPRARLHFRRARPPTQGAGTGPGVSRPASLRPAPLKPISIFWEVHS